MIIKQFHFTVKSSGMAVNGADEQACPERRLRRPSGRPKGDGGAVRGNPFPRAPGGSRVAAGVKEAKPPLLNENGSQKGCRIFRLVDYTDKFSNFFEDLLKLDRFAQSIEDELNRNVSEEEESREDL